MSLIVGGAYTKAALARLDPRQFLFFNRDAVGKQAGTEYIARLGERTADLDEPITGRSTQVWLSDKLSARLSAITPVPSRRARRPDSLAAAVIDHLDDFQCPVSTTAIRIILNDRGRAVTAEQLSRLAAYQREDYLRTRVPPELCAAIAPNGTATRPRWWARGHWRLQRRILTDDVKPIWIATLAERLCSDLADRPIGRDAAIVNLTLGAVARVNGGRYFDIPMSKDEWIALRAEVYGRYIGAFSNRAGATSEQHDAEARLNAEALSGFELLFGRAAR